MKKVNLIVPCYNEAEALPLFKDELNKVIQTLDQYTFEILLINDGSTDTTLSVMKEICDTDSHYKYISFSRNFGKEAAMYAGFCNSDGDYAAIMDADMQDPPALLPDIEKEKREAIEAGRRALNSLRTAKENLNSAKNWGLVDMFGGGFFTTLLKHSKMDQAKRNMEQAKYDLRSFSRELNDVNMACNLNINTGDFLSFADYFFDGFVVDWVVQDRINNAKRQVEEAIRRTESIVNQLQRM